MTFSNAGGPLIVAIDGPSGVGKSTTARLVAAALGIPYLDTGAMYRAFGWLIVERGIRAEDRDAVVTALESARLELERGADGGLEVLLDGESVGDRIRTPRVSDATSRIAVYPEVRSRLVAIQREFARREGGVLEGRDIGSRVVPETPFKFFLDAPLEVRIERRRLELAAAGREASGEALAAEIAERDRRDQERSASPLVCTAEHERVDTSLGGAEEVATAILSSIWRRLRQANPEG
ncbi:MAG: (d)CMP kinase [Holophagales bacterium]|nr:MAG: (d)CMP kinase [Holophagales bacterium]